MNKIEQKTSYCIVVVKNLRRLREGSSPEIEAMVVLENAQESELDKISRDGYWFEIKETKYKSREEAEIERDDMWEDEVEYNSLRLPEDKKLDCKSNLYVSYRDFIKNSDVRATLQM